VGPCGVPRLKLDGCRFWRGHGVVRADCFETCCLRLWAHTDTHTRCLHVSLHVFRWGNDDKVVQLSEGERVPGNFCHGLWSTLFSMHLVTPCFPLTIFYVMAESAQDLFQALHDRSWPYVLPIPRESYLLIVAVGCRGQTGGRGLLYVGVGIIEKEGGKVLVL